MFFLYLGHQQKTEHGCKNTATFGLSLKTFFFNYLVTYLEHKHQHVEKVYKKCV